MARRRWWPSRIRIAAIRLRHSDPISEHQAERAREDRNRRRK
jgi:hypothetical protein